MNAERELTRAEKDAILARSEPLAPMCEKYLDFSTLGRKDERPEMIDLVGSYFEESSKTTMPYEEAERFVWSLDPVTLNMLRVCMEGGFFSNRTVNVFLNRNISGLRVRNYMLLMYGIQGAPERGGTSALINGLHKVQIDEGGRDELVIDLSTDDLYIRNVALFRYGVWVLSELEPSESYKMFVERPHTHDLELLPKIREIIWNNPEQADRIAQFVVSRKEQDADIIREMVQGKIPFSLADGII